MDREERASLLRELEALVTTKPRRTARRLLRSTSLLKPLQLRRYQHLGRELPSLLPPPRPAEARPLLLPEPARQETPLPPLPQPLPTSLFEPTSLPLVPSSRTDPTLPLLPPLPKFKPPTSFLHPTPPWLTPRPTPPSTQLPREQLLRLSFLPSLDPPVTLPSANSPSALTLRARRTRLEVGRRSGARQGRRSRIEFPLDPTQEELRSLPPFRRLPSSLPPNRSPRS